MMGNEPLISDAQLKTVLTNDFRYYGLNNIKFFFEQNETLATGVFFHIRGGVEGPNLVTEMREEVKRLAKRAANTNPVFGSTQ